jgi:hypothetical protein
VRYGVEFELNTTLQTAIIKIKILCFRPGKFQAGGACRLPEINI